MTKITHVVYPSDQWRRRVLSMQLYYVLKRLLKTYREKIPWNYEISRVKRKYILGSLSQEIDCRLCAEAWECPMEDRATENLRLESFAYDFSQAVGRSLPMLRIDLGRFWNVSLKYAVISRSNMHAIIRNAMGHWPFSSIPVAANSRKKLLQIRAITRRRDAQRNSIHLPSSKKSSSSSSFSSSDCLFSSDRVVITWGTFSSSLFNISSKRVAIAC